MGRTSNATAALLGRDNTRTILSGGVVLALLILSFVAGLLFPLRWLPEGFALIALVVIGVPVVFGTIAAANASWNGGIVLSWFLVFAPAFGWLMSNAFTQAGPIGIDRIALPLGVAVFAASVVGTIGYAVGRLRVRGTRGADEVSDLILRLLVGDESSRPAAWGVRAGVLFFGTGLLIYLTRPGVPLPLDELYFREILIPLEVLDDPFAVAVVVIAGWTGLAMWPAYRKEGLLLSWLVTFGPLFGASLADFVLDGISGSGPLVDASFAFLLALVHTVLIGTCGFVLGRGLRSHPSLSGRK